MKGRKGFKFFKSFFIAFLPLNFYKDYFCLTTFLIIFLRVYLYTDGDDGEDFNKNSYLNSKFLEAISDADIANQIYQLTLQKLETRPKDTYNTIKSNIPIGSVVIKKPSSDKLCVCECEPIENACSDENCINVKLKFECSAKLCPASIFLKLLAKIFSL